MANREIVKPQNIQLNNLDQGSNGEGFSFVFWLFLCYLVFLFLRPIELFFPWLEAYRPMLFIWLAAFSGSAFASMRKKIAGAQKLHYGLLLWFWLQMVLSHFTQGDIGLGIEAISGFSASALLFFLISFNLSNLKRVKAAATTTILCFLALVAMGTNAYYTGHMAEELVLQQRKETANDDAPKERPPIPAEDESGAFMWRVRGVGIFNDPNDFAQGLVMVMPMLWWFYSKGRWIKNFVLVVAPSIAIGYCITLTNSRGALIGIASLAFFGIRDALGTTRTTILMVLGGLGAIILGATGGRGFSSKEQSAGERIESWYEGFQMLKMGPLFGVGWGNFTEFHHLTAHNSFVLCFAELGLIGYFVWIALIVTAFKGVNRVAQYAPVGSEIRLAGVIFRASLIGYLSCAWFLSRTYQPTFYALLAFCAAVWVCAQKHPDCRNIPEIQAPLDWGKHTLYTTIATMSAVYLFIFMHHI